MRVAVLLAPNGHYKPLAAALIQGIEAAGDTTVPVPHYTQGRDYDAFVCWGWRNGRAFRRFCPSTPVLVMERGYVGDRFHWTSLGWNGLNGNAKFARPLNDQRYFDLFPNGLPSWRVNDKGYALILGQVASDQACAGMNMAHLYRGWVAVLTGQGHKVRFRQHPQARRQQNGIPSALYTTGTLAEDLAGAKFTVSWNSNSSVDAVLAGVPSVTLDRGSMAWGVTSHDLNKPVMMPPRADWAAKLAWCQWQPSELRDGSAWRAVREVKP